ncbi:hypothetical protein BGZ95_006069, partial [Linnemannia exigua]
LKPTRQRQRNEPLQESRRPSTPSRFPKLEEANKRLFRSPIAKCDRTVFNAIATIQLGTIELIVPQYRQGASKSIIGTATTTATTIPVSDTLTKTPSCRISELTIKVVEEFIVDSGKASEKIGEVALLGPYLDQEYRRKLLNCLIAELETAKLLAIDLLQ